MEKRRGIKSKKFKVFWQSMFMIAFSYPDKPSKKDKIIYSSYYDSLSKVIPCKFCRDYIKETLNVKYPLNFSNQKSLMYSIYLWKDNVNNKLIKQGCDYTKPSPQFETIYKKYSLLEAKCKKGKCV